MGHGESCLSPIQGISSRSVLTCLMQNLGLPMHLLPGFHIIVIKRSQVPSEPPFKVAC